MDLDNGLSISAQILGVEARKPETIQISAPVTVDFIERDGDEQKTLYLAFRVV